MENKKDNKELLSIEELKKEYNKQKEKYGLPEFSELNEIFDIEELDTETEFFLRKLRKIISDRVAGYLRFLEIILNPSNAPMFFFTLIKLDNNDKETLTRIYEKLGNLEIEVVKLDLEYKEEKEVEFIKKVFKIFSEIRNDILKVVDKMTNDGNIKKEEGRSYFG